MWMVVARENANQTPLERVGTQGHPLWCPEPAACLSLDHGPRKGLPSVSIGLEEFGPDPENGTISHLEIEGGDRAGIGA